MTNQSKTLYNIKNYIIDQSIYVYWTLSHCEQVCDNELLEQREYHILSFCKKHATPQHDMTTPPLSNL